MSHIKTKQIAGPTDAKQGSVIVFDTTPKWSTDLSTALALPTGTAAQRPQTPSAGMLRYNSDAGAVEVFANAAWTSLTVNPNTFMRAFTLCMAWTDTNTVGAITGLPAGWTIVSQDNTSFTINHGMGRPPFGGHIYGQTSPDGSTAAVTAMQSREFTSAMFFKYDTTNLNVFQIYNVSSNAFIGTAKSGFANFHIFF